MDDTHREFFEDACRSLDHWVRETTGAATNPAWDMLAWEEAVDAVRRLQSVLVSPEDKNAFRQVVFEGMVGLLHSVMAMLDGASELADHYTITITTSTGKELGPGLDELLANHLYESGRLPYHGESPS